MNYGKMLKFLREENELKQIDIANYLNIDFTQYSHYESENRTIPIKHLNACCNYFDVSLDYIFGFTNIKQYKKINKEINKTLSGNRLKELRKSLKYTQTEFANILNNSYGTIAGYEKGRYIIATPFIYEICKKYGISADYLLGKIDSPKYYK